MQKIITQRCPKCNNNQYFFKYGKDKFGNQKYLCKVCKHQFAPNYSHKIKAKKYPPCPNCGKASFIHHDFKDYTNYRCCDKKCNHSFFTPKPTVKLPPSMSVLVGKHDFKRMRHSLFLIFTALTMSFIGKSSSRNIAFIFKMLYNIKVSHVTIADWCKKFAPLLDNITVKLIPSMNFNSDEWHADETVVKINGIKHYIWFIIDSETRFVLGFHLSPHRDSPQAHTILNHAQQLGNPRSIVSDRYSAYKVPVKCFFPEANHIRVESFKDDISNNLIESFNGQFKAWYKIKRGFNSFDSANSTISAFIFFFNFIRPHMGLDGFTPAQVAGADYDPNFVKLFKSIA
jgi:transposase-like protein/DNA-directed RNA polymerase subunit RPC12/RpoP